MGRRGPFGNGRLDHWNVTTSTWSTMGIFSNGDVLSLSVSGSDLYVGGNFTDAGEVPANRIARWNGTAWSPLSTGINSIVRTLFASGTGVHAGGSFNSAGGTAVKAVARWDTQMSTWAGFPSPINLQPPHTVHAINEYYGSLISAGLDVPAGSGNIKYWTGTQWSLLGGGCDGSVNALATLGSDLYVGGGFTNAGGLAAPYLSRLSLATTNPIANWRQSTFGLSANLPAAADDADFDGDGLTNLIEYAFALNPLQSSTSGLPSLQPVGQTLSTTFTGQPGVTYHAECSEDLNPNTWCPLPDTGSGNTHTFALPATGPRAFLRFRVTNP